MHSFTARHKGAEPQAIVDFSSPEWQKFTPYRAPDLVKVGRGQYQRYLYSLQCTPIEEFIIDNIDGERTIGQILALPELSRIPSAEIEAGGRAIFEHQWKLGHIMIGLPRSEAD